MRAVLNDLAEVRELFSELFESHQPASDECRVLLANMIVEVCVVTIELTT
jgi:hypothetical protein